MTEQNEIPITKKTIFSYGLGGLGKNLAFGLVSTYTLYYYNTVLGISAAFIGTLLMFARVFDAFNDPLMGVIVAKTRSRFGRYKPWIFTGSVLNALIMFAMFSVPKSLQGGTLKLYVAITYLLCGITYTLSDIPFWSIIPAITKPGHIREKMTSFARLFAGIGAGAPTIFTMSLVYLLGGGHQTDNLRIGFSLLTLIFSIVYVVTAILNVINLPDNELCEPKASSTKELFRLLIKNDQAMSVALIIVLFNTAIYLTTNLVLYIFQFDIQKESSYVYFMAMTGIVQVCAMLSYSLFRKKFTNRAIYLLALLLGVTAYVLFTTIALFGNFSVIKALLPGAIVSMANGLSYVLITIFVSSAVDYGEVKHGSRENSMISSLQTLMSKLASAIAIFFAGLGIDFVHIDPNLSVQTDSTLFKLRMLFCIPSLLCMLASLSIFLIKKELGNNPNMRSLTTSSETGSHQDCNKLWILFF